MDAGYRLLAAKYIRKQAKALRAQFDGIRAAEDIEFVHRARVASRRLRTAMRMFDKCFRSKQVKRWKKAIRSIRSELGAARDKDVQIEFLRQTISSLSDRSCFAGIARLLVQWECERERLQRRVVKSVGRRGRTLKKMGKAAKRILKKAASREIEVQSPASFGYAEEEILRGLDRLLALEDCLAHPDDRQSHHAMRIAAKRLRYALEITKPIYSGHLDEILSAIKQVQTLLGEIHDCDVWQEQLEQFAKHERRRIAECYGHDGPFAGLNAGIEYLRQDRGRHHQQCFENLASLWKELHAQAVWEKLAGIVQAYGRRDVDSAAAEEGKDIERPCSGAKANDVAQPVAEGMHTAGDGDGKRSESPALVPSDASSLQERGEHVGPSHGETVTR